MLKFKHWPEVFKSSEKQPAYLLIPSIISNDIDTGNLKPRDRLPPIRELAKFLSLDYTTVVRAYKEARYQGLIDSHPGTGTFIKGKTKTLKLSGGSNIEMTMNLPPEPNSPRLTEKLDFGIEMLSTKHDLQAMFRYQDFGGTENAKQAGVEFLNPIIDSPQSNQVLVCPGIHSALVGLMSMLAGRGETVCVQSLVYPGLKAIAAQLGIALSAIDSDDDGPVISQLEALCSGRKISAIYLNPTLQNPTTQSISLNRREAIADVAMHYSVPIIEDDPYARLQETPIAPIASFAPDITYYVTGFSKCFSAGLRTAYLYAPSKLLAQRVAGALRALSVMASPITNALATDWINDGTVNSVIQAIRDETYVRQSYAKKHLGNYIKHNQRDVFHLWLQLPKNFEMPPSIFATYLREQGVNAVSSAAFCTDNNPPNAIRVGLGGSLTREECEESLRLIAHTFEHPLHLQSVVL